MAKGEIYDRLSLLFRRATLLPQLPGSAAHLLKLIETGDPDDPTLERIVTSDPALSASIIRIASSSFYGGAKVTTIRGAILRIGQKSIRSLALSLAMQSMTNTVTKESLFDPFRYSRHALFTGMLASTLHAEVETTMGNMEWESEEVLAVGILHDLHYGIIARIAPEIYSRMITYAREQQLELDDAFEHLYGQPVWKLAIQMYDAWGMPRIFVESLNMLHGVIKDDKNVRSFGALKAAHDLSRGTDVALEDWAVKASGMYEAWPLPPVEELQPIIQVSRNEAEAFLQTTLAMVG